MTSAQEGHDLLALRREIDTIDDAMMALLRRRFALMSDVAATKLGMAQSGGASSYGSVIRACREAEILCRLLSTRGDRIPASVVVSLWRHVIGASSLLQGGALSAHLMSESDRCAALLYFGTDIPITVHTDSTGFGDVESLFSAVSSSPNHVGFLPLSGCWINGLIERIESGSPLRIFSYAPLLPIEGISDIFLLRSGECSLSPSVSCGRYISVFKRSVLAEMKADKAYAAVRNIWHWDAEDLVLVSGSAGGDAFSKLSARWGGVSVGCYHDVSSLEDI